MEQLSNVFFHSFLDYEHGLAPVELTTGFGKTHGTVDSVVAYYHWAKEQGIQPKDVLFVAPQLKALPIDKFEIAFARAGLDAKEYLLRIPSNSDAILENLTPDFIQQGKIPAVIRKTKEFRQLHETLKACWADQKSLDDLQNNSDATSIANRSLARTNLNLHREKLRKFDEPNFRSMIHSRIYSKIKGIENKDERKEALSQLRQGSFSWVTKIYPATLFDEYPLKLLSAKKFLHTIDPIFEKSFHIPTAKFLKSRKGIVVFDEIDAIWGDMEDTIIEDALNMWNDAIVMFGEIRKGLDFLTSYDIEKADNEIQGDSTPRIASLKKRAKEIYEKYHLEMAYRTDGSFHEDSYGYFFYGYNVHTILPGTKATHLLARIDDIKKRVTIWLRTYEEYNKEKRDGDIYVMSLVAELQRFFSSVSRWAFAVATNYAEQHEEQTTDSAFRTVLNFLQSSDSTQNLLRSTSSYLTLTKIKTDSLDLSYYQTGFALFQMENSLNHAENTKFLYLNRSSTPEKIVALLAQYWMVLGLSATTFFRTGRNFNYDYFKQLETVDIIPLQEKVRPILDDWSRSIRNAYEKQGINIRTHVLDGEKACAAHLDELPSVLMKQEGEFHFPFTQLEAIELANLIKVSASGEDNSYIAKRYLEILQPISDFCMNPDAHAWLFLNERMLRKNQPVFDSMVVKKAISFAYRHAHSKFGDTIGEEPAYIILNSSDFDHQKEQIERLLEGGRRVLVFAAYATISRSVNILVPRNCADDFPVKALFPERNLNDGRMQSIDFDGIVLGDITHKLWSLPQIFDDWTFEKIQNDIFHDISDVKNLLELHAIDVNVGSQAIRNLLNEYTKFFGGTDDSSESKKKGRNKQKPIRSIISDNIPVFKERYMSQMVQALGRISRTFLKQEDIHIYITQNVLNHMDKDILRSHPLTMEQDAIAGLATSVSEEGKAILYRETITNGASKQSVLTAKIISSLLGNANNAPWTPEAIALWIEWRDFALKHPTVLRKEDLPPKLLNMYLQAPELVSFFLFYVRNNFGTIAVSFSTESELKDYGIQKLKDDFRVLLEDNFPVPKGERIFPQVMSEEAPGLPAILRYPGMREHFLNMGYATKFLPGKYLMTPTYYNNIYKGALGEAAGQFILKSLNLDLKPLADSAFYEFFDFQIDDDIYVDFKHWRPSSFDRNADSLRNTADKLRAMDGKLGLVINILDGGKDIPPRPFPEEQLVTIPFLIDKNGQPAHDNIRFMMETIKKARG